MCKAHVLRFSCSHGLLMSLETCPLGPCPVLKTTGTRLPQQPYKCYNCQAKRSASTTPEISRSSSCDSSISSVDSDSSAVSSASSASSVSATSQSGGSPGTMCKPAKPLPTLARNPSSTVSIQYTRKVSTATKPFVFSCSTSNHYPVPHYSTLPTFLPHQDHACPTCQLADLRSQADRQAYASARAEYPHLTAEQFVRNGRSQEEWTAKMTLEDYVLEKRMEEKQTWHYVTRKWLQDLTRARVLVSEEDGLGLLS